MNVSRSVARIVALTLAAVLPNVGQAEVTPFTQAVAIAAEDDADIASFYRENGYDPIWTGQDEDDEDRRVAFLTAVQNARLHGLPAGVFDARQIRAILSGISDERDRGRAEVEMSRMFLRFASSLRTGILTPSAVVPAIKRDVPQADAGDLLRQFAQTRAHTFLGGLAPSSREYVRLVREKLRLEKRIESGGWGTSLTDARLSEGAEGRDVIALRDRLAMMGYLGRSATARYDATIRRAVEAFQIDHGISPDGVVGGNTLAELNRTPVDRLGQVLVAMERERWMNRDLGDRHIWVNLTDYHAKIVQDGEVVFATRSVIGKTISDQQTPEFSDEMDHMVINPSWYVPRSITVNEYLPKLRRNPYAVSHLEITDRNGRVVDRSRGFSQYSASSFPFSLRQPPGPSNALGRVKFMFPNQYNIYLHDTPSQSLFTETVRAFSHGCIRLDDPYEFGHALLAVQSDDPVGEFQGRLETGRETRVNLSVPVPVHLVYRTAVSKPGGGMEYRPDIYGRDGRILAALRDAGVALPGQES